MLDVFFTHNAVSFIDSIISICVGQLYALHLYNIINIYLILTFFPW